MAVVCERTKLALRLAGMGPLRILFVDDDDLIRRALTRALSPHELLVAEGLERATAILHSQTVDIVLSDCHMPGGSGIEVLRLARTLQPAARRVMLSGYPPSNLEELQRELLVELFIPKPWKGDLAGQLMAIVGR